MGRNVLNLYAQFIKQLHSPIQYLQKSSYLALKDLSGGAELIIEILEFGRFLGGEEEIVGLDFATKDEASSLFSVLVY